METEQKQNNLSTPKAIVIAGTLIAGAIYFGMSGAGATGTPQPQGAEQFTGDLEAMKPVTSEDHIRGDANAPVKII